jgi:hypothetical protein
MPRLARRGENREILARLVRHPTRGAKGRQVKKRSAGSDNDSTLTDRVSQGRESVEDEGSGELWGDPLEQFDLDSEAGLTRAFEDLLMPLQRDAGLHLGFLCVEEFVNFMVFNKKYPIFKDKNSPKSNAIALLLSTALLIFTARFGLTAEAQEGVPLSDRRDTREATKTFFRAYGYLCALRDARYATGRRGAEGKRKQRQSTNERIRLAARQHQIKGKSKASASVLMAKELNLSHVTIQERLSALFPGGSWGNLDAQTPTGT